MGAQFARRPVSALDDGPSPDRPGRAAALLGWAGAVLPEVSVFGSPLVPVVVTDLEVHRARQRDGHGPQLDHDTLTIWEWPESGAPAPAVSLSGAMFRARDENGRGFSRALGRARRWRPFGPAAVLAPTAVLADEVSRWDCALHGIGLTPDQPDPDDPIGSVVPAETGRRAPARRRTADRWIEESLYALALDSGLFTRDQ